MMSASDADFSKALRDAAGDLLNNPVIKPVADEIIYDFVRSPECRQAIAQYVKRKITEKLGL